MKSGSLPRANAAFESSAIGCHIEGMTETPKRPRNANQLAKFIVDAATGAKGDYSQQNDNPPSEAVLLGSLGVRKGGRARAEKLSAERRAEIAAKAAKVRWSRDP